MNEITAISAAGAQLEASLATAAGALPDRVTLLETSPGVYTGSVAPGTPPGRYTVQVHDGPVVVAAGELNWDGAREVELRSIHERLGLGPERLVGPDGEIGGGVDLRFETVGNATRITRL